MAALLSTLAALFLGACGTQVAGQDGTTPSATALPWTLSAPIDVTSATLSSDQRTVTLAATVPSGPKPCVRNLKAVLTEPVRNTVHVQVTYDSPAGDRASGCTKTTTAKARVKLTAPLGRHELVVGYPGTVVTADGATPPALRRCGDQGCPPPAPGCTPGAIVLPAWTVGYVAPAPGGAHPSYALGYTTRDNDFYQAWDPISRDRDTFLRWLDENVYAPSAVAGLAP